MKCWKCGKEINVEIVARITECPLCSADLHCCKACKFYSSGSHFDCRELIDAPVTDKERSNFCDYFAYNSELKSQKNDKAAAAKDAFNALFGGGLCL
ncbi:MAG: hypothetical protein IKX23_04770 [Treponema sp.]|nr:hypothetical protein [Treponema sp.]